MARKHPQRPTDAELNILQVLWSRGPSTVKQVHAHLTGLGDGVGYTTVLKTMQIMTEKKLLERDETARAHIYRPTAAEAETQQRLLADLAERAFHGSSVRLAMRALASRPASHEELEEMRRLLDTMEKGDGDVD